MKNKIILVGKAASGKDYFKDFLVREGYMPSISHTTRPPREGEEQGITYNFVTDGMFGNMIEEGKFYEYKEFNGWKYGTTHDSVVKSDVFIFTPSGVRSLDPEFRSDAVIVYFDIPSSFRIERLMKRNDADNIQRRLEADAFDFFGMSDYDLRVTNPEFNCSSLMQAIENMQFV